MEDMRTWVKWRTGGHEGMKDIRIEGMMVSHLLKSLFMNKTIRPAASGNQFYAWWNESVTENKCSDKFH